MLGYLDMVLYSEQKRNKLEPFKNLVRKIYAVSPIISGIAHICCRALHGRVD